MQKLKMEAGEDVEHMLVQFCVNKIGLAEDKIKIKRAYRTPTSRYESYESKIVNSQMSRAVRDSLAHDNFF